MLLAAFLVVSLAPAVQADAGAAGPAPSTVRSAVADVLPPPRTRVTDATVSLEHDNRVEQRPSRYWHDSEVRVGAFEDDRFGVRLITGEDDRRYGDWELGFRTPGTLEEGVRYSDPFDFDQRVAHRGQIGLVNASTACDPWGTFELLRYDPAAGEARIAFEARCLDGVDAAVHGEVRVNVETRTVGGVTASDLHRWPDAEVGETSRRTHLVLHHGGTAPARVGKPYVTGRDAGDVRLLGGCAGVLEPGQTCAVELTHTPRGVGPRRATLHVPLADGSGELVTRLRGVGIGGVTGGVITTVSSDGPAHRSEVRPSDHVFARRSDEGIYLNFGGRTAEFHPVPGGELVPGRYEGAQRPAFREPDEPGIEVASFRYSCDYRGLPVDAWFEVHEATYDSAGQPESFAVTTQITCGKFELRAHLAFRAETTPPPPVEPSVSVSTHRMRYDRGDTAVVRVQVSPPSLVTPVVLRFRDGDTGLRRREGRVMTDDAGVATFRVEAWKSGRLVARLSEEVVRAGGGTPLRVRPPHDIRVRMLGATRRDGRTHLYAAGRRARALITVDPPSQQCVDAEVRVWRRGGWRNSLQRRQCLQQDRRGRVVYRSRLPQPNGRFRMLVSHPYAQGPDGTSAYRYFRLRR